MAARRDFARDVKGHIDAVAKYIVPDEGTFGFAMMYVPAENLYYELMVRDESAALQDYALGKRVIPCSPNSMYAYLQALVLGLKGMRVEERAHDIIKQVEQLNLDFSRFRREFGTLGSTCPTPTRSSTTSTGRRRNSATASPDARPVVRTAAARRGRGDPAAAGGLAGRDVGTESVDLCARVATTRPRRHRRRTNRRDGMLADVVSFASRPYGGSQR